MTVIFACFFILLCFLNPTYKYENKSFGVINLTVILAEREENFGNKEVGFGCVQEQTA